MAKILVTSTAVNTPSMPYALSDYRRVLRAAECDAVGAHSLVSDPDDADFLLFVGGRGQFHFDVLRSPLYRAAPQKCFVLDGQDETLPGLPGIYMTLPKHALACSAYCYGFYIRVAENQVLREAAPFDECRHLYSFVGKVTNAPRVRGALLQLPADRALLRDSSSGQRDQDASYADVLAHSKFVLCPRGLGASSWRVFEAMRTGRSPVIISDDWRPPPGPRWDEFAVVVPENQIDSIPQRLEALESSAESMGRRAYEEWQRHFALDTAFHWLGNTLQSIHDRRTEWQHAASRTRLPQALRRPLRYRRYFKEFVSMTND